MDNLKIGIERASLSERPRRVLGHEAPSALASAGRLGTRPSRRTPRFAERAAALFALLSLLGVGCASAPTAHVPRRLATNAPAVAIGAGDAAPARNDARLGTRRAPAARATGEGIATVDDRQWIVNGRSYVDFESRTRSATRLAP